MLGIPAVSGSIDSDEFTVKWTLPKGWYEVIIDLEQMGVDQLFNELRKYLNRVDVKEKYIPWQVSVIQGKLREVGIDEYSMVKVWSEVMEEKTS